MNVWKTRKLRKSDNQNVKIFIMEDLPKEMRLRRNWLTFSFKAAASMLQFKGSLVLKVVALLFDQVTPLSKIMCDAKLVNESFKTSLLLKHK